MKNSNRFITVFLAFLLLLTACFPVFGFAAQLDDRKNEVSGTQGQDTFQYDHATAEAVPAGESTVSFPSFHVEPVGETTKAVMYGEIIAQNVYVEKYTSTASKSTAKSILSKKVSSSDTR